MSNVLMETAAGGTDRARARRIARNAGLIATFTLLTAAAGQVKVPVPFSPVPLTLQLLPVLVSGAALGPAGGAASQLALLALGAAGLPVFAGGAFGPAHLLGATGGYLLGFVGAAWLVGRLLRGPARPGSVRILAAALSGAVLVHAFGALHLAIFLGGDVVTAFEFGSLPFLAGDALKAAAAAAIVAAWPRAAGGRVG